MPRPRHSLRRQRGFALLVTITLVAFLVLILVSLATLTRVETRVAANSQQMAQARQNALMALNIAVGQLQKYTGPDQRTTARADLENGAGATNSHWIGAYGSSIAPDYDATPSALQGDLTAPANVATNGSSARLLNWLVSGNENVVFDPAPVTGDVGADGEILNAPASDDLTFVPTGAVSGLSASTDATDLGITINNASGTSRPARLLLGAHTVDPAAGPDGNPADFVVAPAVDIKAPASSVPGMGSSGDITVGRYAWWAGDEGMKARVNLPLAGADASLSTNERLEEKQRAFTNATRAAVELMAADTPGWSASPPALNADRIGSLYEPDSPRIEDILESRQLPLVSSDPDSLADTLRHRFHDVTSRSMGVLSDTYAGGLRQDLTRILANPATGPSGGERLWKPDNAAEDTSFIPSWGHLRSFHNHTTDASGKITPRLPTYGSGIAGDTGVSPVMTYFTLGFRYTAADTPAAGVAINLDIHPLVVLWNPYDKTMAGRTYEVGMGFLSSDPRLLLQVNKIDTSLPDPPDNWQTREIRDLRLGGTTVASGAGTGGVLRYFRFSVACPDIPPGQSLVFTLQNSGGLYVPGTATLVPGLNPHFHVSLSNNVIAAGEEDLDYRVLGQGGLNSNHHVCAYLGDGTAPPATAAGAWDPSLNRWYQTVQRVDYAGVDVGARTDSDDTPANAAIYADAAPLDTANPVYEPQVKTALMSIFSATGKGFTVYNEYGLNIPRYRWIAQANIRAPYQFRSRRDPNMNTPWYAKIGNRDDMWPTWYLQSPTNPQRASSGHGLDYDLATGGVIDATLFEVRDEDQPLLSIGQLQHANLSLASAYPSYAVGNAIADFRLPVTSEIFTNQGTASSEITTRHFRYYDASWLLNRTLWDRYFFSGVKSNGTRLNPRMVTHLGDDDEAATEADLQDHRLAAAHLLLAGGFNVNSTSEQAWRAVLGGLNQLAYDPEANNGAGANATTGTTAAFPRFSRPLAGTGLPSGVSLDPSFNGNESLYAWFRGDDMQSLWQGYRTLDENEIAQLARNVVEEVRARGPFVSLADFVNRRLIDNTPYVNNGATTQYRRQVRKGLTDDQRRLFLNTLKGALQAAIDATYQPSSGAYPANELANDSYWKNTRTMSSLQAGDTTYYSLALARGDLNDDTQGDSSRITPSRTTSAFAPKYLTQADVLSAIGSGLSARSDTFTVRGYGETVNPVTQAVDGRAWCEAVVQRLPEYLDSAADPADTAPSALTSDENRAFGRKYRIISFRWLSPDDI